MSQERIQPRPYLKLLMLAMLLGRISALITFIFLTLVHAGRILIWEQVAQAVGIATPVFTLIICALGGLLVGTLQWHTLTADR